MTTAFETLVRMLELEREGSYEDKAVMGGLEKFIATWRQEASRDGYDSQFVAGVAALMGDYSAAETREARAAILDKIMGLLSSEGGVSANSAPVQEEDMPTSASPGPSDPAPVRRPGRHRAQKHRPRVVRPIAPKQPRRPRLPGSAQIASQSLVESRGHLLPDRLLARARRRRDEWWANLFVWILSYWAAFFVTAVFGVSLEGPHGGIWYWCVVGFGVASVETYRRQCLDSPAGVPRGE